MGMFDTAAPPANGVSMETTIEAHPAIPAVFHPDCAHWLTLFAGRHLRALTNWLYWYPHTEEALQSLHLCGPSGTGKSMLTAALAQFYGGKFCAFDRVDTPYSPELLSTALVVLDETTTAKRPIEIFRALVSNPARVIKPRSAPPVLVHGNYRCVITTGHMAPPPFRDVPTMDDLEALLARTCYVRVDCTASDWLIERGGKEFTKDWVKREDGSPGRLAEHIQWLCENYVPPEGLGRFKALAGTLRATQ